MERGTATIRRAFSDEQLRTLTKTKQERTIPLSDQLVDLLAGIRREVVQFSRDRHVFTYQESRQHGKDVRRYTGGRIYKIWRKACEDAGILPIPSLYSGTRHSFASQRVNDGKSRALIGAYMGHADPKTTDKYAHADLKGLATLIERRSTVGRKTASN